MRSSALDRAVISATSAASDSIGPAPSPAECLPSLTKTHPDGDSGYLTPGHAPPRGEVVVFGLAVVLVEL